VNGFQTPESVKWDSAHDVYLVSNINGAPNAKDGNGYISRVSPAGSISDSAFIKGLNAPKGMALVRDTLWVADIDEVRAFNVTTGAPVADVKVPGALFLNDIAAAPDGSLYITDTAIRFGANGQIAHPGTDQIFRIAADHQGERRRQKRHTGPSQRHHMGCRQSAVRGGAVRGQNDRGMEAGRPQPPQWAAARGSLMALRL
jgi:sugar lactone lactonase YvrE